MRFGFLAHAVGAGHRNQVRGTDLLGRLLDAHRGTPRTGAARHHVALPPFTLTSALGARCSGMVRQLPHTAEQLLRRPNAARELVAAEAAALRDEGARLIGLGGATSIVGDRGLWTAKTVDTAVTSGNSLTTYAALAAVRHCAERLGRGPGEARLTVVGYPGSIGLAMTRLLLADGYELDLVRRPGTRTDASLLRYLEPDERTRVTLHDDPAPLYDTPRLYVSASSTGGALNAARMRPGSVVVDVALPRDVAAAPPDAHDVLVIDAGLVSATDAVRLGDGTLPAPAQQLNGCLAETIVLALEERAEPFSLGRELDLDRIRTIGELAAKHGFLPTPLASFGRIVDEEHFDRLARHAAPRRTPPPNRTAQTARRFRGHVNPPMARLFAAHGMDRVFTRAQGCTLTTEDGTDYLDFVAGYGCLNLGHNHPAVTAALRGFLDDGAPTFVQYVSMPAHTAELAERLSHLAPPGLDRVFFSNSGAEAVEAALKVARAGTGRTRLVYAENSYHGKTLGALSVTGRSGHTSAFRPLLPDCVAVPYGDTEALAAALDGAAALILEPVQGEGGVVLPPPGYLAEAQRLCRRAGAAFVLDEIQTGLGRTGAVFAAEHDGLEPDVLCVAKSLSGGLVPLAATLVRTELWDSAYGSTDRAMLHSSTFGGGNLAAAVGLATLDTLTAERLPERARTVGTRLREQLREVCAPHSFVREVRGIGLMNAIEFDGDFSGAARALADEALTRLPGDLRTLVDWLPDQVRDAVRRAGQAVESSLGDLMCLRFVAQLARDHRILTFVTANSNRVLRIQPPLLLSTAEADRFVGAIEAVCQDFALHTEFHDPRRPQ
ncbi:MULTISPECIES: aminotransferase class III-fold pyridoxal phosphate-dependent enzyme [unclassified Streptomyces]|uniref:aminotransferase class III-fold pyridoxal phosphate-dependent enzyme n=1 Tax=unclassified Streptomyces TaxID=2593676 RepID=UPI00278C5F51|nr:MULTISPECIES: aminotransferase class III-fold pyridoxal phosphate-dependent enzyme [unclassified Streptomyces]